jgi:hypothetical protein
VRDRRATGLLVPADGPSALVGCARLPVSHFAVRDARRPRGYGYVIWGTAGDARSVVARFDGGVARAARLVVPQELACDYGEGAFTLFVIELPPSAAGGRLTVEGDGRSVTRRVTVS